MAQGNMPGTGLIDDQALALAQKEWRLFQRVRNYGGPAACQFHQDTFLAMRCSQFMAWPPVVRERYERDLDQAAAEGRNLVAEKYAYMMRDTFPKEYAALADRLPAVSPQKEELVRRILSYVMAWSEEMEKKYPWLMAVSRPVHAGQDALGTSIETYTRGELETFSMQTLALLLEHYQEMSARRINIHEVTVGITVRLYGFQSLEDAERLVEQRMGKRLS